MIDKAGEKALLKQEKKSDLIEEILELLETLASNQKRIVELITENDRLTLKYEPYFPPEQDPGYTYMDLIEENERLRWTVAGLKADKEQTKAAKFKTKTKLKDHCLTISFDPWPLMEWKRFSYSKYNPGKYMQICVGPLRVDWFVA